MIITVTLNPRLDRTIELDSLTEGSVQRVTAARLDPPREQSWWTSPS